MARRQRPHWRTSKRGKKFRAGRGKVRLASQLRRDEIRMLLKSKGYHRKDVVGMMEKDPLLWREYLNQKRPKVIVDRKLFEKKKAWGLSDPEKNIIRLEKRLFTEPLVESQKEIKEPFKKNLQSDFPVNPRETSSHEIEHLKYPGVYQIDKFAEEIGKHKSNIESMELQQPAEEMATLRSMVDIRKFKKPHYKLEKDIKDAFEGPLLKRRITWKKITSQ